ncbi:MAG: phosphodiesterase [Rhizobiales bacterium]|nr:phosphodiesterase [Hyphomicrobiales bacterium]
MKIISHRGVWKTVEEKNSLRAFERSFNLNFGTETDLRDYEGEVIISHDPPVDKGISLQQFLSLYKKISPSGSLTMALNIKADGLASIVSKELKKYETLNYFVFDMSVPDMRSYLNLGLRVFARLSEQEKNLAYESQVRGVWLDGLESAWFRKGDIEAILAKDKEVCIVSPDLHGRDHLDTWRMLKEIQDMDFTLCTDLPEDAQSFF